jgi:haloacetate dehalogenase
MWRKVAPALPERFTVVATDLRGYGLSSKPPSTPDHALYSKRAMARDQLAVMRRLGHERFLLAGHDRGARVGYRLCLDHPDRAARFAALDIIPTLEVWERMGAAAALGSYHWSFLAVPAPVPERLIGADPGFYVRHLLERWAGRPGALDPAAVAAYVAQFDDPGVIAATCADYRAGASTDRADDAADRAAGRHIACPVLVLWGRRYLRHPPLEIWRAWAVEVEECALECGHFLAEEEPAAVAEALIAFFEAGR